MNFTEIRSRVIRAMFSDEMLPSRLVLKGGNALELVHGVITRGSIDVDLSIEGDFSNVPDTRRRILEALQSEFNSQGYLVFDDSFAVVPPAMNEDIKPWWGGYQVEFKLIEMVIADSLQRNLERMRIQSQTMDPQHSRRFRIDISKHEYCAGKAEAKLDGRTIFVYTEEMCAIEKLRAICQQMPEYGRTNPTPRARDFFDVSTTITRRGLDLTLPENLELFRLIFGAKYVPLHLLSKIDETREFHRPDWVSVTDTVQGRIFAFDVYFDSVLEQIARLETLWKE